MEAEAAAVVAAAAKKKKPARHWKILGSGRCLGRWLACRQAAAGSAAARPPAHLCNYSACLWRWADCLLPGWPGLQRLGLSSGAQAAVTAVVLAAAQKSGSSRAAAEALAREQQLAAALGSLELRGPAAAALPLPSCKQLAAGLRRLRLPGAR